MDLKKLDYFVQVADLRSFTKAAAVLSIAQSALSHQVRQLEIEVDQTLLYRNGRGVMPTDAGRRLLAHARGILIQVRRARDEMSETKDTMVGHVTLGMPSSIARLLTVPLVKSFRTAFPKGRLGIVEALSVPVVEWLVEGRLDMGLVYNPASLPSIEIRPLHEQELYLISSRPPGANRQPQTVPLRDLPRYPLIIPSRRNANRILIESQLALVGLKPQIELEIDGIASILDLVYEGYGHAVLPLHSLRCHAFGRSFIARPIVRPKLSIRPALVTSAHRPVTPLARETVSLVETTAARVLFPEKSR
ncbi:MAG TPA: LysR substrate-binding domain-containing protein [Pseudolabrys sp.]|jgi:LysR family nitrogen assimilation transcriptional regulator|nr:LysR substrate-binding domain-containing protein [Pseudolabrys sp.]